jgi:hypothetical protein
MRNPRKFLVPAFVLVVLGACADVPTGVTSSGKQPAAPSFDGGHVFGSGAAVDTTTSAPAAASTNEATAGDTTSRGGHTFGSGA